MSRNGNQNLSIQKSKVLVVEGKDEVILFGAILKVLRLHDGVQIFDTKGKTRFPEFMDGFARHADFSIVKSIGVVQDADEDASGRFQSVCSKMKELKISVPSSPGVFIDGETHRVGVFITPNNSDVGCLETTVLRAIADKDWMPCVDTFKDCVAANGGKSFSIKDVARAAMIALDASEHHMGRAAEAGKFDFEHAAFTEISSFLKSL